jgi:hypothetical protein
MDIIEAALQTWPLAQTPDGFSRRVLQRIETTQNPRLKFQFTWLDYALSLFTVSVTFLAVFIWNVLPAPFIMTFTYRMFLLLNMPPYQSVLIYSLFGIGGFLVFIMLAAILFIESNTVNRKLTMGS